MKIEILCGGGSPNGVHLSDIYGNNNRVGVGGAELALLTLCEGWSKLGYDVILYNNPNRQDGVFEQRNVVDFDRVGDHGDVVIFFREPTYRVSNVKKGKKVFFSCDQYTTGNFAQFSELVDTIVTISPYHSLYFVNKYGIKKSTPIDLPVRTWDYETEIEKVPDRLIFTSVPDRGLKHVANIFPKIKEAVPNASLVITSDFRLWGVPTPMNSQYLPMFLRMKDVEFLGAIPRKKLIEEQKKAQVHIYPCIYDELFCISVAESQVAGTFPITTDAGALATTNMGMLIHGTMDYVEKSMIERAVYALTSPDLKIHQEEVKKKALERFCLSNILRQWDEKVFNE